MSTTIYSLLLALALTILSGCKGNQQQNEIADQPSTDTTPLKSVKDMREDLSILWSAIKEIHPGYGIYTNTDSLQDVYDKTYEAIQRPLTEDQFITVIYPFLCSLRCGHTQIKHSESYKPATTPAARLPFKVLVRDHRAWVTAHQTDDLHTADEILSMNDVPVKTIIDHGYGLYGDDGYNETFKELFLSEYDGFEDVCNKYYHWQEPYRLKLRTNSGAIRIVEVKGIKGAIPNNPSDQKTDRYKSWITEKSIPDARLRFLNNAPAALFRSTPFAYTDTAVFKNVFELIRQKGTKTLILDLRHNTGGDIRVAAKLLSYVADSSFRIVKDVKSRLPNPAINNFSQYFDASIAEGFMLGFKPGYKEGGWYHIDARPAFGDLYGPFPTDKRDHFNGKLLILIDGATFSSGALFAAAVKAQRKGVIYIGRETAGSEEGCNGVTLQKLTLPHTKIIVDFPLMRVISMAKNPVPGRGIMPDYTVTYSPDDIVTEADPDLMKALSILSE